MDFIRKIIQNILSEGAGSVAQSGHVFKRLKFKDIDNWEAVLLEEDGGKYWMILNAIGNNVGELDEDGVLRFDINSIGSWEIANAPFDFDEIGAKQAARYIYLKTQQPSTQKITSEDSDSQIGKETVVFKDLDNWKAISDFQDRWSIFDGNGKYQDAVYHGKSHSLAYYDNTIDRSIEDKDIPNLKQAVRYLYLIRQKPVLKSLTESKDFIPMPDVSGYNALYVPKQGTNLHNMWEIYNEDGQKVVNVYDNGAVEYRKIGKYFNGGWSRAWDINFGFDDTAIKQVARWYYLHIVQKQIAEGKWSKPPEGSSTTKIISYKNIPGYYVELRENSTLKWVNIFQIASKNRQADIFIGQILHGLLRYKENPDEDDSMTDTTRKYDVNKEGIQSALRFIYLKLQKPTLSEVNITEETHGVKVAIPEVKGWSVIESTTSAGIPWWDILDEEGAWVGYLMKVGDFYKLTYTNTKGIQESPDRDFGTNYANAARYIYLMRQESV